MWAAPRAPPPESTSPTRSRLVGTADAEAAADTVGSEAEPAGGSCASAAAEDNRHAASVMILGLCMQPQRPSGRLPES